MTIIPIEFEPYDPSTPRLGYEQVSTLVQSLPDPAIAMLLRGPIPIDGTCGVCEALEGLADDDVNAKLLMDWHNHLNTSKRFNRTLEHWIANPWAFSNVDEERHQLLDSIQYARCCVIYALAQVEFTNRKEKHDAR